VELALDDDERLTHAYFRDAQRNAIGLARFAGDEDNGLIEIINGEARTSTVPTAVTLAAGVAEIHVDDAAAGQPETSTLTIDLRAASYDEALLRDVVADLTRGYGVLRPGADG
jgi:hypothetical protein